MAPEAFEDVLWMKHSQHWEIDGFKRPCPFHACELYQRSACIENMCTIGGIIFGVRVWSEDIRSMNEDKHLKVGRYVLHELQVQNWSRESGSCVVSAHGGAWEPCILNTDDPDDTDIQKFYKSYTNVIQFYSLHRFLFASLPPSVALTRRSCHENSRGKWHNKHLHLDRQGSSIVFSQLFTYVHRIHIRKLSSVTKKQVQFGHRT